VNETLCKVVLRLLEFSFLTVLFTIFPITLYTHWAKFHAQV